MNVALVPGIFGFDRLGLLEYFNGVARWLEDRFPGLQAAMTRTDPLGTVADRGEVLAEEIVRIFGAAEDVHLIAHSLGGLDARFLASNNLSGLGARVKTIVSISTPHMGSPVASVLEQANPFDQLSSLLNLDNGFLTDLRGKLDAVRDLSESAAALLNAQCTDVPHIRYLEVAGVGRDGPFHTSNFYALTYLYVHARAGRNDGLVPMTSAQRQRPLFALWAGDHADLIGHDLNGPTPFSTPNLIIWPRTRMWFGEAYCHRLDRAWALEGD
jgi:triacylglycerol lipase